MARTQSKKSSAAAPEAWRIIRRIAWVLMAGACLIIVASLVSFDVNDPPSHTAYPLNNPPANWCGWVGAYVAFKAYQMFGLGAWVVVAGMIAWLIASLIREKADDLPLRIIGLLLMAVAVSGVQALFAPKSGPLPEGGGGLLAIYIVENLTTRFSTFGTTLILLVGFGVGATLAADRVVMALPGGLAALGRRIAALPWAKVAVAGEMMRHMVVLPGLLRRHEDPPVPAELMKRKARRADPAADQADADSDTATAVAEPPSRSRRTPVADAEEEIDDLPEPAEASAEVAEQDAGDEAPEPALSVRQPLDADAIREKIKKLPLHFASAKPVDTSQPVMQDLSGYKFPGPELLHEPETNFNDEMAAVVREQAEILESALQTFRIDAEVVAIDAGPVITLYDVQLAPGTKASAIQAVSSDVARELKAANIRIVPNTAGKSTVGIEVPNLKKEKVRLKELLALAGTNIEKMRLPMFLGKDASGNPLIADLASMPHMLIAGTTGSGKSVCINSIIMSFLLTRRPDELKLVLVDPKMVEMSQFRDIPHLMCPVVTEMSKAAAILEWAVTKMDERYELLAEAGVRDIDAYNGLGADELYERMSAETEEEKAKIPKKLYRMVYVIDELADLMMTHKEVEGFIVRIAQKARAVGIHLILATQRPSANVVTGLIKSNMPCRVALKVASGMDSRIVLDSKGAELLLGHGDMLFLSPRTSALTRAQGTLVDDAEVRSVVKFLKSVAQASFEPQLMQLRAPSTSEEGGMSAAERDPLFEKAVEVILETKRGPVSLLQRRLTIGYSRASRLIEQMGEYGIIGEYKGSQAREVQITLEDWEAMKAHMAATEADGTLYAGTTSADPEAELEELADDDDITDEERELAEMADGEDEEEDRA